MNIRRTAIIFVVCAALAAWFSAAMTPNSPSLAITPATRAPIDASGAALAAEIARLHERLRPDVEPQDHLRNPFVFRSVPRAAAAVPKAGGTAAVDAPAVVLPSKPDMALVGVAEDAGPNGPVRTAIVSSGGQVFLVKEGELLTVSDTAYRVSTISETSVDLTEVGDGTPRRLALR